MKANNGSGNVPERDDWETPQWLWDQLNDQYMFTLDCCSSRSNKKTSLFSDDFEKVEGYRGVSWINPPFSKAYAMLDHFFKVIFRGVGIYRCDNLETAIWQKVIFANADWVFVFNKRISYEGKAGKGARFGSALFGVGLPPPNRTDGVLLKLRGGEE